MRQHNIFMTAAAATLLLSACSDEMVTSQEERGEAITFRAATSNLTRTAESYCNNYLPESFKIYAKTSKTNSAYINGETATRDGETTSYKLSGGDRYWPNTEGLDFFAYKNDKGKFNNNLSAPQFVDYEIDPVVANQLDLIYSKQYGEKRPENGGDITLNFRHALSQVVFRAKVTNPNIKVSISGIAIGNLMDKGTFVMTNTTNTNSNWEDNGHNDELQDPRPDMTGLGTWINPSSTKGDKLSAYNITFNAVELKNGDEEALSSSPTGHASNEGWANVMTLLPQTTEAWVPGDASSKGSYLRVKCEISNAAGTSVAPIHDGYVYIPLAVNWEQGVRYVYTINFGNGHGGWYDPKGDDDDDDPTPPTDPDETLENISVSVSTDDFIPVGPEANDPSVKIDTYTVVYTDGVDNVEVFEDQITKNLNIGDATPEFKGGEPVREGYAFMGWTPTIKETVDPSMATNNVITYTATWNEGTLYTVNFYNWIENTEDPNGEGEYVLVKTDKKVVKDDSYEYKLEELTEEQIINKFNLKTPLTYGQKYTSFSGESKDCVTFLGWSSTKGGTGNLSGSFTMTKSENTLNLYTAWKFMYGIRAEYNVVGVNQSGYVSNVPEKNQSGKSGINKNPYKFLNVTLDEIKTQSLIRDDVERNGYNIVGFNKDNRFGKEETHTASECDYPIGTPIYIHSGNNNITVYPVYGTPTGEHKTI